MVPGNYYGYKNGGDCWNNVVPDGGGYDTPSVPRSLPGLLLKSRITAIRLVKTREG